MGARACMKKLLDNPAQLGAEAAALMVENFGSTFLAAEAAALKQATEYVALGFQAGEFYAEEDTTDYQKFHQFNQRALDESYEACDYAKELRKARDEMRDAVAPAHAAELVRMSTTNKLAMRCRKMRDEVIAIYTAIAEEALHDEGYEVPTT